MRNLSGGNQQKVLLARWLATEPRLFVLDEPTRGIDVGAKAEVEKLIQSLRQEGLGVLFISSQLEEVVRQSQRVVVLRDRRKVDELTEGEISEEAICYYRRLPVSKRIVPDTTLSICSTIRKHSETVGLESAPKSLYGDAA
jgi:ABC-type sugar transport system ATPase subunit